MDLYNADEELKILRELREGRAEALEKLYLHYREPLAKSLLRLLKDRTLAEDILQETFIKIWEKRAGVDPERAFGPYLYQIAINMVYDIYRRSSYDQKLQQYLKSYASESYSHVEEQLINQEQLDLLEKLLNKVPPQRRKVFELFKIEGKSYQEISVELGISKATINSHITKVNRFLRDHLGENAVELVLICSLITI